MLGGGLKKRVSYTSMRASENHYPHPIKDTKVLVTTICSLAQPTRFSPREFLSSMVVIVIWWLFHHFHIHSSFWLSRYRGAGAGFDDKFLFLFEIEESYVSVYPGKQTAVIFESHSQKSALQSNQHRSDTLCSTSRHNIRQFLPFVAPWCTIVALIRASNRNRWL